MHMNYSRNIQSFPQENGFSILGQISNKNKKAIIPNQKSLFQIYIYIYMARNVVIYIQC